MIKYFCDNCGNEFNIYRKRSKVNRIYGQYLFEVIMSEAWEICESCMLEILRYSTPQEDKVILPEE
jgi:hypothetical protein